MSEKEWFTTPIVELVFPWLSEPDYKYDKNGKYQTKGRVGENEREFMEFEAEIEGIIETFKEGLTARRKEYRVLYPWAVEYDRETDEPTGCVLIKASLRAHVPTDDGGFDQAPTLKDTDGNTIKMPVWSGSSAVLEGHVVPYCSDANQTIGVTLRLFRVTVIDLVTGTPRAPEDRGGTMPGHAR